MASHHHHHGLSRLSAGQVFSGPRHDSISLNDHSAPEISRSASPVSAWFDINQPQSDQTLFDGSANTVKGAKSHFVEDTTQFQPVEDGGAKTASWGVYWKSPALMAFFLVAGIGFALGHHFHYQSLNGTIVTSETKQQWAIRIGTGLAFLCKASLVASVGVAYTQRLWVTVKRKPLSLQNLDNAFSLTTDPFSFFSSRVLISAKILCLLAASMWCIPIVATITPATLSIRSGIALNTSSVDVSRPSYDNEIWSTAWVNFEGAGSIDSPSAAITRLVAATSSSIGILPLAAPRTNASYTLDFYAPAIRCENLSAAIESNSIKLADPALLQKAWDDAMSGELAGSWGLGGGPLYAANRTSGLSDWSLDSHLFVNTNGAAAGGRNYSCHLWNTSYTVAFTSRENGGGSNAATAGLSTTIKNLTHVAPVTIKSMQIATDYQHGEIAYWSVFDALARVLESQVKFGSTGSLLGATTDLFKTGIPGCPEVRGDADNVASGNTLSQILEPWMCRAGSVPAAIEDLSHNVSLSLMSSALFSNTTAVAVTVAAPQNFYAYDWHNLLYAYAAAVAVALACVAAGAHAYAANGYSASASFSAIMCTTRNRDLDRLAAGRCLGEQPMPKDLRGTVLRYGVLRRTSSSSESSSVSVSESVIGDDGTAVAHAAFGFRDSVEPLKKGKRCS